MIFASGRADLPALLAAESAVDPPCTAMSIPGRRVRHHREATSVRHPATPEETEEQCPSTPC